MVDLVGVSDGAVLLYDWLVAQSLSADYDENLCTSSRYNSPSDQCLKHLTAPRIPD